MGLGDGTSMYGKSALDEPTGTKKYSMAPMSAGEKAASRERKSNNLIDRNLQRAMRRGSPAERIAAGQLYQKRSSTPGYQQGGGITSADDNREADRITASNYTKEGLQLKNNLNQNVNPGTAQDANDVERGPVNVIGRELPGGTTPYTNTPTPFQGSYSPEYFAKEAFRTEPNISEKGTNPNNIAEGLAATQGVGNASNPVATATAPQGTPVNTTTASSDTMADRGNSKIAGYQKATADAKTKFANDLKQYGTSGQRSPEKDAQIREYGKTLNLNEDQINAAMRGDTKLDAKSAAASNLAYEKNVANKAANIPEARNKRATNEFSKAYGNYLNGEGKNASIKEKDAKYAELKGTAVKDGFDFTKEAKDKEELPAIKQARIAGETAKAAFEEAYGEPDTKGTKRNFAELRSKTEKAAAESKAARDVTAAASKEVGIANKKIEEREANEPARVAKMNKDYADNLKALEIIKAGSDLNMQDIVRNSEDAKSKFSNPFSSSTAKDIKSPEFDLNAFEKRSPDDINFGQKVYKSQYDKDGNFTQQPNNPNDPAFGLRYESDKEKTALEEAESIPTLPESQENAVASAESKRNPILQDLTDAGNVWDSRWKRDARIVNNQLKKEGDFARSFTKTVGGGLIDVFGSAVGGKTGEKIKSGADAFEETIDNLNLSRPQASVNTKRSIQKSATDVLSFSDNLNKYLV